MLVTDLMAALSDPIRLAALAVLWDGEEHCVCELMTALDVSQSRMSRHMGRLKATGLLVDRRDAQWVRYRRNPRIAPEIAAIVTATLDALPSDAAKAL